MINPKEEDIGRKVIYDKTEEGIINSFNESFVFVKFGNATTNQGCRRQNLEFL